MPKPPLPDHLDEFLKQPNPGVIASLRPDGSPHTAPTWYLWEDGRIVVNMDESRKRLEYLRNDPRVSLSVLGKDNWGNHVTLRGRVASIEEDAGLEDIDRIARHYIGDDYPLRDDARYTAVIEVESFYSWSGAGPWKE
jgi:PPOX class probable F420-dependent enzyme